MVYRAVCDYSPSEDDLREGYIPIRKHEMLEVKVSELQQQQQGAVDLQVSAAHFCVFLVICAGYQSSAKHCRHCLPKVCVQQFLHENSTELYSDVFLVKDKLGKEFDPVCSTLKLAMFQVLLPGQLTGGPIFKRAVLLKR